MTKIGLIDLERITKETKKLLLAFVDENALLSISTLKILRDLSGSNSIPFFYINVEENKECFSKFSLRIIPTIHLYESGLVIKKINLPYTKEDLECLIR